ncbi:hypothetical protein ACFV6F_35820 [Kitasatospora phosalacinea]|uniref:hypothetical protein n=1 Tax=Kitasatospora phosalacinea TaxID=2065 RepID=UPI003650EF1A
MPEAMNGRDAATLVEAAVGALVHVDDEGLGLGDVLAMPQGVIARHVREAARNCGADEASVEQLVTAATSPDLADGLTEAILGELRTNNDVAQVIDEAYARRKDLMGIDPLTISSGALLLVALRLRRLRITRKDQVDIQIDMEPMKTGIVNAILRFLRGS